MSDTNHTPETISQDDRTRAISRKLTDSETGQETRRGLLKRLGALGIALGLPGLTKKSSAAPGSLTGDYLGNQSGRYYLREVDLEGTRYIFWFGEAGQEEHDGISCDVAQFANVLIGVRSGSEIHANWADVPKGTAQKWGSLTFSIADLDGPESVKLTRTGYEGTKGLNTQWTALPITTCDGDICGTRLPLLDASAYEENVAAFQEWVFASPEPYGLTGVWRGDDDGTYYIRQLPEDVFGVERVVWFGERGSDWSNVFWGQRAGDFIFGPWADVPKGGTRGSGLLELEVRDDGTIRRTNRSGFGGRTWERIDGHC